MILSERTERALVFAACKHQGQTRKGSDTPYITHPVAVAAMVHEHGGGEDLVVAALLHDTVEDCGGLPVLDEIRAEFGDVVAAIVDGLTDSYDQDSEKWQVRKERYINRMAGADASIVLVAACDKLHNARSILADHGEIGAEIWGRFRGGKDGSIWYYRSLVDTFAGPDAAQLPPPLFETLENTVIALERAAAGDS